MRVLFFMWKMRAANLYRHIVGADMIRPLFMCFYPLSHLVTAPRTAGSRPLQQGEPNFVGDGGIEGKYSVPPRQE